MRQYLDLLRDVLEHGSDRPDRTGVGNRGVFGRQMRFDLSRGFPLLTTKKLHVRSIIVELLWFLRGETNTQFLHEHGVSIWDEWADERGELGPIYGKQWRSWATPSGGSIDQMEKLVEGLKRDKFSRRHIVSAWNPAEIEDMALPPCHCLFQFHVEEAGGRKLNCQLYQRSADIFLGVPFNVASYALLTLLVARAVKLDPGEFIHTFGDLHLYNTHVEQAREQLTRQPGPLPKMSLNPCRSVLFDWEYEDFELLDYRPCAHIKAEVAV